MSISFENAIMVLVTGLTNMSCFPGLYLAYHKRLYFQLFFGIFTFITSFMYHSLESLEIPSFYLTRSQWHKLDNIGSIECFIMLTVYLMDTLDRKDNLYVSNMSTDIDLCLNLSGLFITIAMQEEHPWALQNTAFPILLFFTLMIFKIIFIRRPRINFYYLNRGLMLMGLAIYFFINGLDDENDYLRINHGLWHCFASLSSFYMWQCVDKDKSDPVIKALKLKPQVRFDLWRSTKAVAKLEFLELYVEKTPHFY